MMQKTNHQGFYKCSDTGVILHNDELEYKRYMEAREQYIKNNDVTNRIDNLESDIKEIKSLLQQVLLGIKNG